MQTAEMLPKRIVPPGATLTTAVGRYSGVAIVSLLLLLSFGATRTGAQTTPGAVDIGSRRELSVDHYPTAHMTGTAALRLHRPVDCGHVLEFDRPWEGAFSAYVTVIH